MPNWSITTNDLSIPAGEPIGVLSPLPFLTIVPAAGYSIAPENFVVGGATPLGNNRYEGGNVDNVVEIVEFVQEVGDVNVKANVTLDSTATLNANSDINIDIDESSINPVINDVSGACINMSYPLSVSYTHLTLPTKRIV